MRRKPPKSQEAGDGQGLGRGEAEQEERRGGAAQAGQEDGLAAEPAAPDAVAVAGDGPQSDPQGQEQAGLPHGDAVLVVKEGGGVVDGDRPARAAQEEAGDEALDGTERTPPVRRLERRPLLAPRRDAPQGPAAEPGQDEAEDGPDEERRPPAPALGQEADRQVGQADAEISRAALDAHGVIELAARSGPRLGDPGDDDRMVEAGEDAHQQEEDEEHAVGPGQGGDGQGRAKAEPAEDHQRPVLAPERDADDQELDEERRQQAEVGQDPDLGIVGDEEILGEEKREDHRRDDRGGVGQGVEERCGEKDPFLHGSEAMIAGDSPAQRLSYDSMIDW